MMNPNPLAYLSGMGAFTPTSHAWQRMAQRNISLNDIYFVIRHGQRLHRAGAIIFYLRKRDIPQNRQIRRACARLEGTTVVLNRENHCIITVFRNRRYGLRNIKQKPRHNCRPPYHP